MQTADKFCSYSSADHKSSLVALRQALDNLESLFQSIGDAYQTDLKTEAYEHAEQDGPTEEELREMVRRGEEIQEQKKRQGALGKNKKKEEAVAL